MPNLALQLQCILGMDAIAVVGGISITAAGAVCVQSAETSLTAIPELMAQSSDVGSSAVLGEKSVVIEDEDFVATVDDN